MTAPIRPGDVVVWHPESEFNTSWLVTRVHRGRLDLLAEVIEGDERREIRRTVEAANCQVVGRQEVLPL